MENVQGFVVIINAEYVYNSTLLLKNNMHEKNFLRDTINVPISIKKAPLK